MRFVRQDLSVIEEREAYDLVTAFDVIHDQAQPRTVLKNVAAVLKPSGTILMVDIKASSAVHENLDHPLGPFLYTVSTMHCMTVSLARDGEGLGTMWGAQKALELLAEAGFTDVAVKQVAGDSLEQLLHCQEACYNMGRAATTSRGPLPGLCMSSRGHRLQKSPGT